MMEAERYGDNKVKEAFLLVYNDVIETVKNPIKNPIAKALEAVVSIATFPLILAGLYAPKQNGHVGKVGENEESEEEIDFYEWKKRQREAEERNANFERARITVNGITYTREKREGETREECYIKLIMEIMNSWCDDLVESERMINFFSGKMPIPRILDPNGEGNDSFILKNSSIITALLLMDNHEIDEELKEYITTSVERMSSRTSMYILFRDKERVDRGIKTILEILKELTDRGDVRRVLETIEGFEGFMGDNIEGGLIIQIFSRAFSAKGNDVEKEMKYKELLERLSRKKTTALKILESEGEGMRKDYREVLKKLEWTLFRFGGVNYERNIMVPTKKRAS
ncbi:MAG: hypothetical protein QXY61_02005 [Candidatus Anstonellales archaeon]